MIPLTQAHKILAAVGLMRRDNEAQQLAARILYDPLVAARTQEFIWSGAGAAPEALAALHPLEKSALLDRLRIAVAPAARRGTATWAVRKNKFTDKPEIFASCAACGQSMTVPYFTELLGEQPAPKFSHCIGEEAIPEKVVTEFYVARSGPSDADKKYEYDVFKERNQQIVDAQARKDRALAQRLVGANNPQVAQPHMPDELELFTLADKVVAQAEKLLKKGK